MLTLRPAQTFDHDAIWRIFHAVVARGDTYAFEPTISRDEALGIWLHPGARCYVAELDGAIVGTYIVKANRPGPGSHVAR